MVVLYVTLISKIPFSKNSYQTSFNWKEFLNRLHSFLVSRLLRYNEIKGRSHWKLFWTNMFFKFTQSPWEIPLMEFFFSKVSDMKPTILLNTKSFTVFEIISYEIVKFNDCYWVKKYAFSRWHVILNRSGTSQAILRKLLHKCHVKYQENVHKRKWF